MALKVNKNKISVFFIFFILILIILFLFQSTFIDFFNEKEEYISTRINSEIKIGRNKYGFTKIKCKNQEDYYFATGFMQANDRFIQLELLRRIGKGELSSFLKIDLSEYDKILRDMNLIEKSEEIHSINPEINKYLQKYIEGINLFISQNKNKLPLEFGLINFDINKFDVKDIYLINEVYNLMYDNNLKINLFTLISSIKLGKNKTNKLFKSLNLEINKNLLNSISTRKYTYGELNYLKKVYELIELLNYGIPIAFDSPYYIKSENQKLFSFNHYSKTFLNFLPYYQESFIDNDTISAFYKIGLPFPIFYRKNNIVFSELSSNKSSKFINLYGISDNKLEYKNIGDTAYSKFEIGIDTIQMDKKSKLKYKYQTKDKQNIINYDNENFTFAISIISKHEDNNFNYLHNLIFKDSVINYNGNYFSYVYFNNNLKFQIDDGKYLNKTDTINFINSYSSSFYSQNKIENYFIPEKHILSYSNLRLRELLSDDHKFSLTDLRLINNDNKNIIAEKYLDKILKFIGNYNNNEVQKEFYYLLKDWDLIDEINKKETELFTHLCDEFIKNYLTENYDENIYKYIFQTPYLKLTLLDYLFKNINEKEIKTPFFLTWGSFSNKNINNYRDKNKIEHILSYYIKKDLLSLDLEKYKGSEFNIKFFHKFEKNLITNNASIIFNLNENKNYLILNSGQSARLESTWYKNLFKIWTTGGLVESELEFQKEEIIIEIKKHEK